MPGRRALFQRSAVFCFIHGKDLTVLAANGTYLRYLGNRLYQESWGIYAGRRGTREGCPVGQTFRIESVLATRPWCAMPAVSKCRSPSIRRRSMIMDGNIDLVIEIFAGTKEIERLAEESRNTQQRYQQLFNAVPSSIVVLDRRFRINAVNRRFREVFGEHSGRLFSMFSGPEFFLLPGSDHPHHAHWRAPTGRNGAHQQRGPQNQCHGLGGAH